jgi:hypothetical protein
MIMTMFGRKLIAAVSIHRRIALTTARQTTARQKGRIAAATSTALERWLSTQVNETDVNDGPPRPPRGRAALHGTNPSEASGGNGASAMMHPQAGHAAPAHPSTPIDFGEHPRVSLLMELKDEVGILHEVLKYFWKYDINVSRIESRPVHSDRTHKSQWKLSRGRPEAATPVFDFFLDFHGSLGDAPVQKLMNDLAPLTEKLLVLDEKDVHWFPRHICK